MVKVVLSFVPQSGERVLFTLEGNVVETNRKHYGSARFVACFI